jgi:hypothetical protein
MQRHLKCSKCGGNLHSEFGDCFICKCKETYEICPNCKQEKRKDTNPCRWCHGLKIEPTKERGNENEYRSL